MKGDSPETKFLDVIGEAIKEAIHELPLGKILEGLEANVNIIKEFLDGI